MGEHAKFSASASERWLACPGSLALPAPAGRSTSAYAAEGTLAHKLLEDVLLMGWPPSTRLGHTEEIDGHEVTVDEEMVDCVERVATAVRELAGDGVLRAESRVHYHDWLGVPKADAFGTADVIVLRGTELQVHDLKYGRGVRVDAKDNSQLLLYAGGALSDFELVADIETVRMFIHQPRVSEAPSEWAIPVADLKAWLNGRARSGAISVLNAERTPRNLGSLSEWEDTFLRPGNHCLWCPHKAQCPKLRDEITVDVWAGKAADPSEFDAWDTDPIQRVEVAPEAWIAALVPKLDMIEDWAKAVRARALVLAEEGKLPGYKVVAGRRGARAWADKAQAEELLRKTFRLPIEKAYDLSLISPTSAEKLAKAGEIGERQWKKAQALIVQPEGKPHLAPANDPRPALRAALSDFDAAPAVDDIC